MSIKAESLCVAAAVVAVAAVRTAAQMQGMPEAPGAEATGADILNFALNLECLEAEFYSYAAFGHGLSAERRGGGPEAMGGRKAMLSPSVQALAEEIAEDEIAHVDFLRAALGDAAVPCPAIDIGPAFVAAANAAAGSELFPEFDPYTNDVFFLHGAFIFEDVGVTAYRGAVAPLADLVDGDTLSAAAAVLAVEAYHAGAIRTLLSDLAASGEETPFGPITGVVELISDLRDAVDGPDDLDQGIVTGAYGTPNIVPADSNGLVFARSVAQVLAIVYLGGDGAGGFFPDGVTGLFGAAVEGEVEAPAECPGRCRYRLTFDMQWSPETHPINFPMDPAGFVFPFWTVPHDKTFTMWTRGGLANPGIQQIAETGAGGIFMEEVAACGAACGTPAEIPCDPMSGVCSGSGTIIVDSRRSYFSTGAMLAPSPDWFTGVDTWQLCGADGTWIESMSRPMAAYDAGTDVGPAFLSPDMPNDVRSPIFSFGQVMPPAASVFYNPATGEIAPVGMATAELLGCS
eukprot:jgi/Ulvmu1/12351/UM089_0035.1